MPDDSSHTAASHLNSKWPESLRALRHRNYQLFFAGQLISLIGTWMDQVAESWLVYRLTGSALLLGTVAFSSQIPVFLLAPIGGALADRLDRRKILICTQSSIDVAHLHTGVAYAFAPRAYLAGGYAGCPYRRGQRH
jgi:MFS family permease